jgi:lysozyme
VALQGRHIAIGGGVGAALVLAVTMIMGLEGRVNHVYPDPVTKGAPWTYCDGSTTKSPQWGKVYSDAECDAITVAAVKALDAKVMACIGHPLPDDHKVPDKVRATFDSLAWNIGIGAFCGSTLAKKARAGHWAAACNEMLRWDHAGGKVIPGLSIRRDQEYRVCLDGAEQ